MPYEYIVDHIPTSTAKNRRPGIKMIPEYITIHSTANPSSTARQEREWLTNPNNTKTASWHICIDDKQAVEAIPLNEVAWHAGDGRGPGNMKSISVEICESGDRDKTLQNTAELVAKILFDRKWTVERTKQHYDWSGKNCPRILRDTGRWPEFLSMVRSQLEKLQNPPHWAQKYYDFLTIDKRITINDKRFDDVITRGEVFALLARILGYK